MNPTQPWTEPAASRVDSKRRTWLVATGAAGAAAVAATAVPLASGLADGTLLVGEDGPVQG